VEETTGFIEGNPGYRQGNTTSGHERAFYGKGFGVQKNLTPADAVLTPFLNLGTRWVPHVLASGFLPPENGIYADMHTAKTEGFPALRCWLKKTNVNHAHRRGSFS